MTRLLLLIAALVAGASSFVYTCNEVKRMVDTATHDDGQLINGTRACVVLPAAVKFPYNDDPYTWYLMNTYVVDTDSGREYELTGFTERETLCYEGEGPWFIRSDDPDEFKCSSKKFPYAEIIFIFTSDEPNIVRADATPTTSTFGKGTHVLVAPEGSLFLEKKSIADSKETTLQFYSGAGTNEQEERFSLMPEKFIPGASTVIIGPVTTLVIEDDVNVDLTLTSFQDSKFISAQPGFSFSLMTTGRANDLQSSRPSIVVSTAYGINDDSIASDSITITGTVKMDDSVPTLLKIECAIGQSGIKSKDEITETGDVVIKKDCSSVDITYTGSIAAENIDRSSEVIYLNIVSNPDPNLVQTTTTDAPDPDSKTTVTTRRTPPPTSPPTTHSTVPHSTSTRLPSTTVKIDTTTTSASGISFASLIIATLLMVI